MENSGSTSQRFRPNKGAADGAGVRGSPLSLYHRTEPSLEL